MHVRFHKFNVTLPFDFHFSFHCIQQFLHMKRWLLPTYVLVYDVGKHVGTREHGKTTTRRLHAQKIFDQDFLIKSNYLFITFSTTHLVIVRPVIIIPTVYLRKKVRNYSLL